MCVVWCVEALRTSSNSLQCVPLANMGLAVRAPVNVSTLLLVIWSSGASVKRDGLDPTAIKVAIAYVHK